MFTPAALDTSGLAAEVEVIHLDPGELTLTTMMRRLRSAYDVRSILCEGGPTLFGALLQEDLVDELFLSLAPKLAGGGMAPGITRDRRSQSCASSRSCGRSRATAVCTCATRFTEPFHLKLVNRFTSMGEPVNPRVTFTQSLEFARS